MTLQRYVTSGHVDNGTLRIRNMRGFDRAVSAFRRGEVLVTIERRHATRSKAQNDYYHSVVVEMLAEELGNDPEEMHEILKAHFLPRDLAELGENGRIVNDLVIGGSTKRLNKLQFIEYLERIIRWAAELPGGGLVIPDPDPAWKEKALREVERKKRVA